MEPMNRLGLIEDDAPLACLGGRVTDEAPVRASRTTEQFARRLNAVRAAVALVGLEHEGTVREIGSAVCVLHWGMY